MRDTLGQIIGGLGAALALLLLLASIYAGLCTPPADRHRQHDQENER